MDTNDFCYYLFVILSSDLDIVSKQSRNSLEEGSKIFLLSDSIRRNGRCFLLAMFYIAPFSGDGPVMVAL